MIGWCAWLVLAPLVVLADGLLLAGLPLRVDLAAGLAMFFALSCRGRALPGLIALLALARAVLTGGGLAAQYLALALPVAAVRPVRAVLDERSWLLRGILAPAIAWSIPRGLELFAGLSGALIDVLPSDAASLLTAVFVVPLAAWLFAQLPPLRGFSDRVRRRARGEA